MNPFDILKKPVVTEKANALNEQGKYSFIVHPKANKIQIKRAVEAAYGVTVEDVKTLNYQGKAKTRYTASKIVQGRTPSYKKAIVTLAEGDFIDFYSGV
ncbi:50S ribosomal protein L23 [Eisenibacter elegans]|jgi:large subunit ribosomal protein L23|uniref:50S ribosomal protein L23 n=1 Tax=Eisenibacter elegans TaxID=997 RepID=UPI000417F226|nr:50S ribosomal protein L23 [Eisenibacter elegans]